ncbi:MAG: hypothetical protein M3O50_05160, partial [Myxococcota bacterium]|nr:hypothetical protein [Myxococcota bacterium]
MTGPPVRRIAFGALLVVLITGGLWVYFHSVWLPGASVSWRRNGVLYELLSPRMLGIVLLVPYFLWVNALSLADLPAAQRALSVFLRVLFVAALALGLA